MLIRTAQPGDFEQIANLLSQLHPKDPRLSTRQYETLVKIINSDHLKLLVADEHGFLTGTCYLNIILNLTRIARPYAVIENVITDINHRRKGVGKALIAEATALSWEAGCYKIMLMTGRDTEAAHSFYRSCGFVGEDKHAYILRAP